MRRWKQHTQVPQSRKRLEYSNNQKRVAGVKNSARVLWGSRAQLDSENEGFAVSSAREWESQTGETKWAKRRNTLGKGEKYSSVSQWNSRMETGSKWR